MSAVIVSVFHIIQFVQKVMRHKATVDQYQNCLVRKSTTKETQSDKADILFSAFALICRIFKLHIYTFGNSGFFKKN